MCSPCSRPAAPQPTWRAARGNQRLPPVTLLGPHAARAVPTHGPPHCHAQQQRIWRPVAQTRTEKKPQPHLDDPLCSEPHIVLRHHLAAPRIQPHVGAPAQAGDGERADVASRCGAGGVAEPAALGRSRGRHAGTVMLGGSQDIREGGAQVVAPRWARGRQRPAGPTCPARTARGAPCGQPPRRRPPPPADCAWPCRQSRRRRGGTPPPRRAGACPGCEPPPSGRSQCPALRAGPRAEKRLGEAAQRAAQHMAPLGTRREPLPRGRLDRAGASQPGPPTWQAL